MILQQQCKELGEWFNDTYPKYVLDITYKSRKGEEEYILTLGAPINRRVGLVFKKDIGEQQVERYREKFLSANKRAIAMVIDSHENAGLLVGMKENTFKFDIPIEQIVDEIGEKDLVEFSKEYDDKKNA